MHFDFRTELGKMAPRIAEGAKVYVFGAGTNWENICKQFKFLVNINIDDHINGFIDNDIAKQGSLFHGKKVHALSEIDTDHAVVLLSVASHSVSKEIMAQLYHVKMYDLSSAFFSGWATNMLMRYEYERLAQFKNRYKGERCFIIGNGPSLTVGDLDRIKNEVSFATNGIFMIYGETLWRPTYYVCSDDELFRKNYSEIKANINCPAFYNEMVITRMNDFDLSNFYFYFSDHRCVWRPDRKPDFSEEPFVLHCGQTVTYDCIQLAAYMGFEEIILLGIDNNFAQGVNKNGEIVYGNISQSHFKQAYKYASIYAIHIDTINAAYETAREYCDTHGIKIYNATRGGKLEAFVRVDFDSLF